MSTVPYPAGADEARLGAQFRSVRERQGMSLIDLSRQLGCSINTVRWHEAGARMMRANLIARAASILGTSVAELVTVPDAADNK